MSVPWSDGSVWTALATALVLSSLLSVLLFRCRIAGGRASAGLAGGLLAGVLLGPGVLGAAQPGVYDALFIGGIGAREELREAESRHAVEQRTLREIGVSSEAVDEMAAQHASEVAPLRAAANAAVRERRAGLMLGPFVVLGCLLVMAGAGAPRGRSRWDEPSAPGLGAGLLMVAFAALPTAVVAGWLLGLTRELTLALGACAAGGCLLPGVRVRWTPEAGRGAGVEAAQAGLVTGSGVMLGWAAPSAQGWAAILVMGALSGLVLRTVLARRVGLVRRVGRVARGLVVLVALPTVVALAVAVLPPVAMLSGAGAAWFVVLLLLLAGDGQLIGGTLGFMTFGSDRQRARGLSRGIESLGGSGLGIAGFASCLIAGGAVDVSRAAEVAAVWGVLLSGLAIELLIPLTRKATGGSL